MKKIAEDIRVKIKLAKESQDNNIVNENRIVEHDEDNEDPFE